MDFQKKLSPPALPRVMEQHPWPPLDKLAPITGTIKDSTAF